MRVIPTAIPDFASLRLPTHLADVAKLRDGIVLVTGPAGSGKSSTLAVLLDCINREKNYHIITIEDPIEFLHNHKSSTIHQRELHSDTPSFAHALRSGAAPGAEGNSGRRDARPRNHRERPRSRRDRPPRAFQPQHHGRTQNRGAHRQFVLARRTEKRARTLRQELPLHHLPAALAQGRPQRASPSRRNPESQCPHPRVHRKR